MDAPGTATLVADATPAQEGAAPPPTRRRRRLPLPSLFTTVTAVVAVGATIGAGILASHFSPTPTLPTVTAESAAIPDESALWTGDGQGGFVPATPGGPLVVTVDGAPAPAPAPAPIAQDLGQQGMVSRPFAISPIYAGVLTSGFGMRWGQMHNGIDIAANMGAPILSVTDGTVIESGPAAGYGVWIRIRQDDGTIGVYGHMENIFVIGGERVSAGQIIASVGSRGDSTGPHLHYEVRRADGTALNPLQWLATRGVYY